MRINVNSPITGFDGEPIVNKEEGGKSEVLTLKSICITALSSTTNAESQKNIAEDEKLRRFDLAMRIYKSDGEMNLDAEEITLLKKRISEIFIMPVVVGRAHELLDPK